MALIFYEILTIPLKISFEIEINETWDRTVDIIFITDIILTFNTAYYKNGKLIYSRINIAAHYLKLWFWIDLLASFPHEDVISFFLKE